ncbi:hypothetical protein MUGA111182_19915 [Mucilaginibacter galii]|uniref:Uncharacterized protein n=1 Tax=Mucilaginibacter galii TaxID=2005073 RepID=A0A917JC48_9SPHI|nr:hypothetical protein [Mucilaginibacter galii]GGI52389.1 hypothetical protein GCM10011425_36010 [Mucilaginibacter galii]
MKRTYSQLRFAAVVLLLLLLFTTNSCRKDRVEGYATLSATTLLERLDEKARIKPEEISRWMQNVPAAFLEQVHLDKTTQNVINGRHVMRVPIASDAALYFTREPQGGALKAWAYKWQDKPGTTYYSGTIIAYSFQDGGTTGMIYENGKMVKYGYAPGNVPLLKTAAMADKPVGKKKNADLPEQTAGILGRIWCWLTGGEWLYTDDVNHGICGFQETTGQQTPEKDPFDTLFGAGAGSVFTNNTAGVYVTTAPYHGPAPATGGSPGVPLGGWGSSTPSYGGSGLYLVQWVYTGGATTDPGPDGTGGPSGPVGPHPGNVSSGYWENVPVDNGLIATNLINIIVVADPSKQTYLYSNPAIATELYRYLLDHGATQENKDFLSWAVDYLMANPQVSLEVFKNQFMPTIEIIADPNANNWTDNDDEVLNDPDQTVYQPYQDSHPWPTIDRVIPFEKFVPMRKDAQGHDVNCLILSKEQLGKAGYTCSGYLPGSQTFQTYTENGGVNLNRTKEAVTYLIDALSKNIPVFVAVDNRPGTPSSKNLDNSTDHFIVVVAMGSDTKGKYFQFMDNSTNHISLGASYNNRLYYNSSTGKISGKTMSQYGSLAGFHDYIVTQVRKSIKK